MKYLKLFENFSNIPSTYSNYKSLSIEQNLAAIVKNLPEHLNHFVQSTFQSGTAYFNPQTKRYDIFTGVQINKQIAYAYELPDVIDEIFIFNDHVDLHCRATSHEDEWDETLDLQHIKTIGIKYGPY